MGNEENQQASTVNFQNEMCVQSMYGCIKSPIPKARNGQVIKSCTNPQNKAGKTVTERHEGAKTKLCCVLSCNILSHIYLSCKLVF